MYITFTPVSCWTPLTHIVCTTCLKFFGHIVHADPSMDHSRALRAYVAPLPRDWNCRLGLPHHTWLQTIESDLAPLNIGLSTAYRRAPNRQSWSTLIGTAASSTGQATRWWWWWWWWWLCAVCCLLTPHCETWACIDMWMFSVTRTVWFLFGSWGTVICTILLAK